jgi:hypothetical protein
MKYAKKYAKIIFKTRILPTLSGTLVPLAFSGNFLLYEPDPSDPITRSPLPFLPGKRKGMVE